MSGYLDEWLWTGTELRLYQAQVQGVSVRFFHRFQASKMNLRYISGWRRSVNRKTVPSGSAHQGNSNFKYILGVLYTHVLGWPVAFVTFLLRSHTRVQTQPNSTLLRRVRFSLMPSNEVTTSTVHGFKKWLPIIPEICHFYHNEMLSVLASLVEINTQSYMSWWSRDLCQKHSLQ